MLDRDSAPVANRLEGSPYVPHVERTRPWHDRVGPRQKTRPKPTAQESLPQRRAGGVLQVNVPDPRPQSGHEALGRLAGEDCVAGVDTGCNPGVRRQHAAHLPSGRERLVPVVLDAERDAGWHALDDGVEHVRDDTGNDDRRPDCLRELDRPGKVIGFDGVEASRADRCRLEATLPQSLRDGVWPVCGVPEPNLDDR